MSNSPGEEIAGRVAPRSLKDELASLKIDRKPSRPAPGRPRKPGGGRPRGGGLGLRLLSFLIWLLPLGLVGGGGYYAYLQYETIRSKPTIKTTVVQAMTAGEAEKLLSAKGYIKSRYQAMIGAKTPGRVEKMLVEEGSRVEAGQLIAVLEHNDMDAVLESRKASIARVEAELEEAGTELREKDRKAKIQANLYSRNQAAADLVQEANAARDMASARARALEARVKFEAAGMKEIEETIRNMNIVAPFAGTVVERGAEVGETITPGGMGAASGRGSVVTLANLDRLEVETDISENLVSRVAVGQPAEISVSAVPNHHYQGRLRRIIPMGDRARGTVKVKVEILDPDSRLFPELVATVHFLPDKALNNPNATKTSLFLAKRAIFEENGLSHAFVVDAKGVLRKRDLEVVVTNDELARVEKGLVAGDIVALDPSKSLRDGLQVKIDD